MLIVKIFQGPGNQLFQFAYGLAAAKRIRTELKVDLSWFELNSGHRTYILDRFNAQIEVATPEEIEWVRSCNGKNFLQYRFNLLRNHLAPRHKKAVVKENLSIFDSDLLKPHKAAYVEGYFSAQNFFADCDAEVRSALTFKGNGSVRFNEIAAVVNDKTVALSVRRGDFVNNRLHSVCSIGYYQRAIDRIKELVDQPNLLVFSDDLDWVKSNIPFDTEHQFATDFEDHMEHMRLMSLCRHHIIPNSTFSWWGAWLAEPKNVIAPDLWLTADKEVHFEVMGHWAETNHTVPKDWIRIPACLPNEVVA